MWTFGEDNSRLKAQVVQRPWGRRGIPWKSEWWTHKGTTVECEVEWCDWHGRFVLSVIDIFVKTTPVNNDKAYFQMWILKIQSTKTIRTDICIPRANVLRTVVRGVNRHLKVTTPKFHFYSNTSKLHNFKLMALYLDKLILPFGNTPGHAWSFKYHF